VSSVLAGVCLALAGTAQAPVFVPARAFTLAWTHTIERQRWEEDYEILPGPPARLHALRARVRGSGAGMEPPEDARQAGAWYEYRPADASPAELRLMRSEFAPDYELCRQGNCRRLSHWLASDGGVTVLRPCARPAR